MSQMKILYERCVENFKTSLIQFEGEYLIRKIHTETVRTHAKWYKLTRVSVAQRQVLENIFSEGNKNEQK